MTGILDTMNQALELRAAGRLGEAGDVCRQILDEQPNNPGVLHLLGVILNESGRTDEAVETIEKALSHKPDYAEAFLSLGKIQFDLGRPEEAAANLEKAVSKKQNYTEALYKLGECYKVLGRSTDAQRNFEAALAVNPGNAELFFHIANSLVALGEIEGAIEKYKRALVLKPGNIEMMNNLGNALKKAGHLDEAVSIFQQAVSLAPEMAELQYNLGNTYLAMEKPEDAEPFLKQAVSINPGFAEAFCSLGNVLQEKGEPGTASDHFRRAMELDPAFTKPHCNLIFTQDLLPDIDQAEQQAERKRWNAKFIRPLEARIRPHLNDRDPERRLRIGYVSADFCRHSASQGFASLLLEHDRTNFDVFCYDQSPASDDITDSFKKSVTDWRDVRLLSDEEMAETIRRDGIDILVDLSGHTRGNRLPVFGYKPAPLQVSGVGHLAPGVSTIDYRLTTATLTPLDEADLYPEAPLYLNSFFGFTPHWSSPEVGPLPCLQTGAISFGFLGRPNKISKETLAAWIKILTQTDGTRLLLKHSGNDAPEFRRKTQGLFAKSGISPDRLTLLGQTDQRVHIEAHNQVDIVLDSFPHGGGMTALESLWMGVPVIGMTDSRKAGGRIVCSINQSLGLSNWTASSPEDYVALAISWAGRCEELSTLRQGLRQRVTETFIHFPREAETAYRSIWRRWCAGEPPAPLNLVS